MNYALRHSTLCTCTSITKQCCYVCPKSHVVIMHSSPGLLVSAAADYCTRLHMSLQAWVELNPEDRNGHWTPVEMVGHYLGFLREHIMVR